METTGTNKPAGKQTQVKPEIYNPVNVHVQDSLGVLMLGIISIILLIGWVKAEQRIRQLLSR